MLKFEDPRPIILPMAPRMLKQILLEVCDKHDIHPNEIIGSDMCDKYVLARAEFYVRARNETKHSYPRIAKLVNKDHTTVLHSVKKYSSHHVFVPIRIKRHASKSYYHGVLTDRQKTLLKLEADGKSVSEMAEILNLSQETSRNHLRAAHQKMTPRPQIRKILAAYEKKETPQAGEPAASKSREETQMTISQSRDI